MGLFRRKDAASDPLSRRGSRQPKPGDPRFRDLEVDEDADFEIRTNYNAHFEPEDEAWLRDDPGRVVREKHRGDH